MPALLDPPNAVNTVADNTLPDIQASDDGRHVALHQAGVSQVRVPLTVKLGEAATQTVVVTANLSVGLPASERGTHMSRFIKLLTQWGEEDTLSLGTFPTWLATMAQVLEAPTAKMVLSFPYFTDKAAPVSGLTAPFETTMILAGQYSVAEQRAQLQWGVQVPISTLCPCSKAISEFGAHNQRALLTAQLGYVGESIAHPPKAENLLALLDDTASCPVFPLLKRPDEKWVTERQYTNPKFVEDVARDAVLALRELPKLAGLAVQVEALESIHGHNAIASHSEGVFASDWKLLGGLLG